MKRGDIFYADLRPVIGSEQGGIRPVLIIQNDIGNKHSPTVICAAITSKMNKAKLPLRHPEKRRHPTPGQMQKIDRFNKSALSNSFHRSGPYFKIIHHPFHCNFSPEESALPMMHFKMQLL